VLDTLHALWPLLALVLDATGWTVRDLVLSCRRSPSTDEGRA